jgi:hypothetical protein
MAAAPATAIAQGSASLDLNSAQPDGKFLQDVNFISPARVGDSSKGAGLTGDQTTAGTSTDNQSLSGARTSVASKSYVPLSGEDRWHNFWNETMLSPLAYAGALGGALGEQIAGQPREWGSGFSGYAKRAGANFAQFGIQESIHQGGAALMRTDPRYLRCACDGGLRRTWHALEMSFLTYNQDGKKTLDIPQLAGAYGGAMLAELPYPSHYSPLVQGVQNGHMQVGANVAINLFKEFAPEISHLNPFRHRAVRN